VDVGQKSILSPILSVLYIVFIFYIFEKRTKNLLTPISVSILHLLIMAFVFLRKKVTKTLMQNFFVVIALFYSYSTNSSWLSNMTNQKSSTSWDQQRISVVVTTIWHSPLTLLWIIRILSIFLLPEYWSRDKHSSLNISYSSILLSSSAYTIVNFHNLKPIFTQE